MVALILPAMIAVTSSRDTIMLFDLMKSRSVSKFSKFSKQGQLLSEEGIEILPCA